MSAIISAFDAKNRLGQLLDRVESGEEITITRHGEPVAMLVPLGVRKSDEIPNALRALKEIRSELTKRGTKVSRGEVRKLINAGRR